MQLKIVKNCIKLLQKLILRKIITHYVGKGDSYGSLSIFIQFLT